MAGSLERVVGSGDMSLKVYDFREGRVDAEEGLPQIVHHWDINQTLIFADSANGKGPKQVIQHALAKVTSARWDERCEEPMSYFDYVTQILHPGSRRDKEVKRARVAAWGSFVDTMAEKKFPGVASLQGIREVAHKRLGEMGEQKVVPSAIRAIEWLRESDARFSIILRTFGKELEDTAAELHRLAGIEFTTSGHFEERTFISGEERVEGDAMPAHVYGLVREGHCAIQDHWKYWNAHEEGGEWGKFFPVDPSDSSVLSQFFDDNIEAPDSARNIVAPFDIAEGRAMPLEETKKRVWTVGVDPLAPLMDDQFFIRHIVSGAKLLKG